MRLICYFAFFIFCSCGSSPGEVNPGTEDISVDASDTITEFHLNEHRLSAVDFNNELTMMQSSMLTQVETLFLSDSASVDLNLENTLFELDLNLQSLAAMKTPEQGEAFLKATINVMNFYKSELTTGFAEIVPLLKMGDLSKKQKRQLSDYDAYFVEQEALWFDTVFVEQEKFAAANNITLE